VDPVYHLMELPTKVLIGDGVISKLGEFVSDSTGGRKVVISSGSNVAARVRDAVDSALGAPPSGSKSPLPTPPTSRR